MFDASYFETNNTLIDESKKLVDEHNKLSYKNISLQIESVSYAHIGKVIPKDSLSKDIISFYEIFTYQKIITNNLKKIINSIDYTHDELISHIDRSDDSIIQLMSSLTGIRLQLIDYHENININLSKQADTFIKYIKSEPIFDIVALIDVTFICMLQKDLDRFIKIDTNDKYFITVGVRIIEAVYVHIINSNLSTYVHEKINDLKKNILSTKQQLHVPFDDVNKLQTFNLFPNDGDNIDIKSLMDKLFNVSINVNDLNNGTDIIETALKQLSIDKEKETGIIIIANSNDDIYFNMTLLSSMRQSMDAVGITPELVEKTNLIKQGGKSTVKKSKLIPINISDKTDIAYVLWTNDMKLFKFKSSPINRSIINKLLRREPSIIIQSYNELLTDMLNKLKKYDDAIAFKRVQYMSFNNSVTEQTFIDDIKTEIEKEILNNVSQKNKFHEWVISNKFTENMSDILDSFKDKLGVHRQMLSAHCHIIYNSMSNKIINKLKQRLFAIHDISELTKSIIKDIVADSVDGNDNIYTRTIASYYLHIA